jgi:hypothetical protein
VRHVNVFRVEGLWKPGSSEKTGEAQPCASQQMQPPRCRCAAPRRHKQSLLRTCDSSLYGLGPAALVRRSADSTHNSLPVRHIAHLQQRTHSRLSLRTPPRLLTKRQSDRDCKHWCPIKVQTGRGLTSS